MTDLRPPSGPADLPPGVEDADTHPLLGWLEEHRVRFLRLHFNDTLGAPRNAEVPVSRFSAAFRGEVVFDGSSRDGRFRVEEPDLLLRPDPSTLRILPRGDGEERIARMICDVYRTDDTPFEGDPRGALKRVLGDLGGMGFRVRVGTKMEFFLLRRQSGGPVEAAPAEAGDRVRRDAVAVLEAMGYAVRGAHPEIAEGQHEIDLGFQDALLAADAAATLQQEVQAIATLHGLRAILMPKPFFGQHGSGMHMHHSLFQDERNAFDDPEARDGVSETLRFYIGGILRHARGFCAVTNPLVNSYKRLVPGFEAPTAVGWSLHGRSPLVRIPARRGEATGCEVQIPDPSANPYLALAVQIAAGMDGMRNGIEPGEPVRKNIGAMSRRERHRLRIAELPRDLGEALDELEGDRVIRAALGEHIYGHLMEAKRAEWEEYATAVHPWEWERYLAG